MAVSMTPRARLHGAVTSEVAPFGAVETFRPLGLLLVGVGGIAAAVLGPLVLPVVVAIVATSAISAASLSTKATAPAAPTTPVTQEERISFLPVSSSSSQT